MYLTAFILLLTHLMGQHCFARGHLSSVLVSNPADGRAGRPPAEAGRVGGRATDTARRASRLRPVRATHLVVLHMCGRL